jgi:beta-lactamase regulating signal transducer with metallopeptidase domain
MLSLLLDSATRSLLLGLVVWALLKLARLHDTRTETAIWTAVLIAALSMPVLSRYSPGLVLIVPHLFAVPPESVTALRRLAAAHQASPLDGGDLIGRTLAWFASHGQTCLLGGYALGFFVCLTRLATGLLLTFRLYRRAAPVNADWAKGRNIRASFELRSPVSLAGAILLTADYGEWSAAKRDAVLAHEEAHIARGDFFVQLAALIHCACFWFSPFAWWLQLKLAEIAETASDEAAILRLKDRTSYAEILVEVSRCAQKTPALIAMAKGSFIQQRVEHILSETPNQNLSPPLRMLVIAALVALAFTFAGAKAVVSPTAVAAHAQLIKAVAKSPSPPSPKRGASAKLSPVVRTIHPMHEALRIAQAQAHDNDVTYNPRALLDPVYTPKPDYDPASTIVHAGKAFYIRSTEKPVADISITYGMDHQTR